MFELIIHAKVQFEILFLCGALAVIFIVCYFEAILCVTVTVVVVVV